MTASALPPLCADPAAFRVWTVCLVALFLKMFALSIVQAIGRLRSRRFTCPEDARVFGRGAETATREAPIVERASWCWRNDLENIPMFLLLALAFVLAGGPSRWVTIYCVVFTVARCLHSVAYLRGLQPHRNLMFSTGLAATMLMSLDLLRLVLT